MTIKELIEKLQKIENQDRIVLIGDSPSQSYNVLLDDFQKFRYEVIYDEINAGHEELESYLTEEDLLLDGEPALVLWYR